MDVAGQFVPDPELLLLQIMELDVVGVGAVFFFFDPRLQRRVLLFEILGLSLVHQSHSFPWQLELTHAVNHVFQLLSRMIESIRLSHLACSRFCNVMTWWPDSDNVRP